MRIPQEYAHQKVGSSGYRVLGLDIDGVCANYTAGFREFCATRMSLPLSAFPEPVEYNLAAAGWPFASTQDYVDMHREAVADGLYQRLPAYPGVSQALRTLSDADVHIRILSHRLFMSGLHRQIVHDTVDWLEAHSIPYMSLCVTGLKDSVDATLYIEDSPSMIKSLRGAGRQVITFDHPYNRHLSGPRITEWPSGADQILAVLNA